MKSSTSSPKQPTVSECVLLHHMHKSFVETEGKSNLAWHEDGVAAGGQSCLAVIIDAGSVQNEAAPHERDILTSYTEVLCDNVCCDIQNKVDGAVASEAVGKDMLQVDGAGM